MTGMIISTLKRRLPSNIKGNLNALLKIALLNRVDLHNVVLARLGIASDFSGYEVLINYLDANRIYELTGDFLEIGAFMGGGSAKLAAYAAKHNKKLFVIDLFDPDFDIAENVYGQSMGSLYRRALGRKSLRAIFDENTRFATNIVVYADDSKRVRLPADTQLCFSYVDGNHNPDYVRNDFYLAWDRTVSGGVIGVHDYVESGGDLPQVTATVDELIEANKGAIRDTHYMPNSSIMLIRKR